MTKLKILNNKNLGDYVRNKKLNQIEFIDNTCIVSCNNVNMKFIIDKDDYELIKDFTWGAYKQRETSDYYIKTDMVIDGVRKKIKLHRFLMNCKLNDGKIIDHINGNTMDNRRINLRFSTKNGNQRNSKPQSNSKSGIAGVGFHKASGKYRARIVVDNKEKYLGVFETLEQAIQVRKDAEKKYFKEFARCN